MCRLIWFKVAFVLLSASVGALPATPPESSDLKGAFLEPCPAVHELSSFWLRRIARGHKAFEVDSPQVGSSGSVRIFFSPGRGPETVLVLDVQPDEPRALLTFYQASNPVYQRRRQRTRVERTHAMISVALARALEKATRDSLQELHYPKEDWTYFHVPDLSIVWLGEQGNTRCGRYRFQDDNVPTVVDTWSLVLTMRTATPVERDAIAALLENELLE